MKNIQLSALLLLATIISLSAQPLRQEVVATAGDEYIGTNAILNWTLGEVVIETISGPNNILTQGFQQPPCTPNAVCQNATVQLDATGNVTVSPGDVDGGSSDACGIDTLIVAPNTFNCNDVGLQTVELILTNILSDSDSCTATVTIADTVSPVANCKDITVQLDTAGNASIATPLGSVQQRLDGGESPKQIFDSGIALDSLYGKTYQGGLIFYMNTTSGTGYVAAASDQSAGLVWAAANNFIAGASSAAIGAGQANTTAIVTFYGAGSGYAAGLCDGLTLGGYSDWFLPSEGEVIEMYTKLKLTGFSSFGSLYWTSSGHQSGSSFPQLARAVAFSSGSGFNDFKSQAFNVRAARAFSAAGVVNNGGMLNENSMDACGGLIFSADVTAFSCSDVPSQSVTLTVSDMNGNSSTCQSTVTVSDTVSPIANCKDITIQLDATGNQSIAEDSVNDNSNDACGGLTFDTDVTDFSCADVPSKMVTLTVTDANSNSSTCTSTVTVADTVSPVANCKDITIQLDATGNQSIAEDSVNDNSTDACGGLTYDTDVTAFTCSDVPSKTVTLTVTDANSNSSTCTSTVTVSDTVSPVANCMDITVYLDATGNQTIAEDSVDNNSTDACGGLTYDTDVTAFTCGDVPSKTVTLTVTDASNNSSTCQSTVTVSDSVSPVANCKDITVQLDATGNQTIAEDSVNNNSTDACGGLTFDTDVTNFSCADIPSKTVTLTVTDANNNSSTCSSTVTATDTVDPLAICPASISDVVLDTSGNGTLPANIGNGSSSDNCSIALEASPSDDHTCADLGAQLVVLTTTDGSNNMDTVHCTYNVVDLIPPVAVCPASIADVYLDAGGNATLPPNLGGGNSTDNCGPPTETSPSLALSCEVLGVRSVILTAMDASGNTDTTLCYFNVLDTISPAISCPANISANTDSGACCATVTYDDPTTSDNCSASGLTASATQLLSLPNGNWGTGIAYNPNDGLIYHIVGCANLGVLGFEFFEAIDPVSLTIGPNLVAGDFPLNACEIRAIAWYPPLGVFIALDASSNYFHITSAGGFTLAGNPGFDIIRGFAVVGTQVYGVHAQTNALIEVNPVNGATISSIPMSDGVNALVGAQGLATHPQTGEVYIVYKNPLNPNGTRWLGTVDVSTGLVTPIGDTGFKFAALTFDGAGKLYAATGTGGNVPKTLFSFNAASDTLTTITQIAGMASGQCFPVGTTVNTFVATDGSGNTDTCSFTVTVSDMEPAVAACKDITVYLDATGNQSIAEDSVNDNSTDACGIDSFDTDITNFSCADIPATTVTLTVTDVYGNTSSCQSAVTVSDTVDPVADCKDITVQLDATGTQTIAEDSVNNNSTDACGGLTFDTDVTDFSCDDLPSTTVTLTVTDGNGNSSTCASTVTVSDTVKPVAVCRAGFLNIELDSTGNVTLPANLGDSSSTDNCSVTETSPSQSYTCADLTTLSYELVATDGSNNTDTVTCFFNVFDNIQPQLSCPGNVIVNSEPDSCSAMVNGLIATATDNCDDLTITNNSIYAFSNGADASGRYPVGTTVVTFTVMDGGGGIDTCSTTVTVNDDQLPTASCLLNIAVSLDGNGNVFVPVSFINNNSSDNCGIASKTLSPQSFTCADLGFNSTTLTVTDVSGNVNACVTNIDVQDNLKPNAVCQNATVVLDSTGSVTVNGNAVDGGSTDNCGIDNFSVSPASFTCADIGSAGVVLTVMDATGNSDTCSSTVNIVDNLPPVALCDDVDVSLDSNGMASITPGDINNGSSDNCAIDSMAIDASNFDCSDEGVNIVTLSLWDASGNMSSCSDTVNVIDDISPVTSCMNISVDLDASGNATIDSNAIDAGSSDACGVAVIIISTSTFTCGDVGSNNVAQLVVDVNGNSSNCVAQVTVNDMTNPVALCQDVTVQLDSNGNGSVSTMMVNNGSTDACGIDTMTLDNTSYTCIDVGLDTVTLTVTDVNGNSAPCSSEITIEDNVAPIALCQDVTVQLDSTGNGNMMAMGINNGSSDACGIASMSLDSTSFDCGEVGANTVTLTVTDNNGNSNTCTATVTVEDNVAPDAVCQPFAVQLDAFGSGDVSGLDIDGGSTDACGIANLSTNSGTYSCADVGSNFTVLLTATDNNGNTDTCSANITVEDNVEPAANCRNITVALDATGNVSIAVIDIDNFSFDFCGIDTSYIDTSSFDCSSVGPNTVTLTVVDVNGNDSTCTGIVTVVDLIPPTVQCQDVAVELDSSGNASITVGDVFISATDVCGVDSSWLDQSTFNCSDVGITAVTLIVSDVNGALGMCDVDVTVGDTVAPVAICNDITIQLDNSGNASILAGDLDGGSSDACGITGILAETTNYTCAETGVNNIQLLVTDSNNNLSSCVAMVTVEDTTDPVAVCSDLTVQLDNSGNATIDGSAVGAGSSDACGIASYVSSIPVLGCNDNGTTITLTVTDNNGNQSTCDATIGLEDNVNPTAICIQGIAVGLDSTGIVTVAASAVGGSSFDNCGVVILDLSPNTFTCAEEGVNPVTITVSDGTGNQGFCTTTITVQDIFGTCIVSCPEPQNISTTNIGYTDATVNWSPVANAIGYVIEGRPLGAGFTISVPIANPAQGSLVAGGLFPGTSYEWQIKTICSNAESPFTALDTFTTLICNTPANPSESILSNSQVNLMWDPVPGAIGYRITGGTLAAPNVATLDVTGQASSSFLVTDLLPGQTYVWRIQAICSALPFIASPNTATRQFTMPVAKTGDVEAIGVGIRSIPVSMLIHPNPNDGQYQVEVNNMQQRGDLVIYDLLGRQVMQREVPVNTSQLLDIDMTRHEKGTYLIRLVYGDEEIVKRVIIH